MFSSVRHVLHENFTNIYRTFAISKYEVMGELRDSKLGIFWEFASPAIQVFTYWFVFGYVLKRKDVDDIKYLAWMLGGMVVWLFVSACITHGCSAIHRKIDVITKMKFPISILPLTVVFQKLFEHVCVLCVSFVVFAFLGYYPSVHWLGLLYYMFAAIFFGFSLSMLTSVLNMLARDTKKLITSCMRLLLYLTPVLWTETMLPHWMQVLVKCNPIYYIVQGYRDCFFYHRGVGAYTWSMGWFWGISLFLFFTGSYMMCKFKTRFIDMV